MPVQVVLEAGDRGGLQGRQAAPDGDRRASAMQWSRFSHVYEVDGLAAVLNALKLSPVYLGMDLYKQVSAALSHPEETRNALVEETLADLAERGCIVSSLDDDERLLREVRSEILSTPRIDTMYLVLSNDCNFACSYCFFHGNFPDRSPESKHMSIGTLDRALELYRRCIARAAGPEHAQPVEPSVVMYGGEPLLNPAGVRHAVERVHELKAQGLVPRNTQMNINTNGSLMTREWAEFFRDYQIEVDVSLDGWREINDSCRRWRSGRGTYDVARHAVDILRAAGAQVYVSCTITEESVKLLPQIFSWMIDELGITGLGFNPLLSSAHYHAPGAGYTESVAKALLECYEIARVRGVYEARIMRKIRAFVMGVVYDRDCCACGRQITVTPEGRVGVCHAYTGCGLFFTDLSEELIVEEHPVWVEWAKRSPLFMSECLSCEAVGICGGGCAYNSHMEHGSIWDIDTSFCTHSKMTLEWLVRDLYAQCSGAEGSPAPVSAGSGVGPRQGV